MNDPVRAVAVSGALHSPSKSAALAGHLLKLVSGVIPCESQLLELSHIAPQLAGAVMRHSLPAAVENALCAVESADILIVVTPVYRGAYTGLLKYFFDFVHQDALTGRPVLLAATGGSARHALVIDHQLRPLFSFFQSVTLPLGVYGTDQDFDGYQLQDAALLERAALAVQRARPALEYVRHQKSAQMQAMRVA